MTGPDRGRLAGRYEVRVDGHLDAHWSTYFPGLTLAHEDDGTTALRGPVADQAELHGHLARVRDLGASLVSVTALDHHPAARTTGAAPTTQEQP